MDSDRSAHPTVARMSSARAGIVVTALAVAALVGCGQDTSAVTADTVATATPRCERPIATATADAASYPASLDEMVDASDVVVEGRIVGDAGAVIEDSQHLGSQPMEVAIVTTYRGDVDANLIIQRPQTSPGVTGSSERFVGSMNGEPWFCPGEVYLLFATRQPDGTYQALPRLGAIPIDPHLDNPALTNSQQFEPFTSLAALDPDTLRSQVRQSVDRAGH